MVRTIQHDQYRWRPVRWLARAPPLQSQFKTSTRHPPIITHHPSPAARHRSVISIEEFFAYYKIPCTPIIKRSFKIMPHSIATDHDARTRSDVKGMGVSFATFFVTLHEFCTMTKKEHLKFCFNLFDLDRSGKLTQSEIEKMIKLVTGKEDTAQAKSIVAAADKGSLKGGAADGQVDFDEFAKAVKKFKKFIAPLWDEQMKLREKTFGKKYWSARQTYKRAYGKANGLSDSVDLIELFHRERQMAAKKIKRVYRDPTRGQYLIWMPHRPTAPQPHSPTAYTTSPPHRPTVSLTR